MIARNGEFERRDLRLTGEGHPSSQEDLSQRLKQY